MNSYDDLLQRRLAGESIPDEVLVTAYMSKLHEEQRDQARNAVAAQLAEVAEEEKKARETAVKTNRPELDKLIEDYHGLLTTFATHQKEATAAFDAYKATLQDVTNGYYRIREFIREKYPEASRDDEGNPLAGQTYIDHFSSVFVDGEALEIPPRPVLEATP